VFALVQKSSTTASASLDPADPASQHAAALERSAIGHGSNGQLAAAAEVAVPRGNSQPVADFPTTQTPTT
jgi:hypothetical protein